MADNEAIKVKNSSADLYSTKGQVGVLFNKWLKLPETNKFIGKEIKKVDLALADQYLNIEKQTESAVGEIVKKVVKENSKPMGYSKTTPKFVPEWRLQTKTDSGISLGEDLIIRENSGEQKVNAIPEFYFPYGKSGCVNSIALDWQEKAEAIFEQKDLDEREFVEVTKSIGITRYLNSAMFKNASKGALKLNFKQFQSFFSDVLKKHYTDESIAYALLKQKNNKYLFPSDVQIAVEEVVNNHIGLHFLETMTVFQSRYVETVVTRLFYLKQINTRKGMSFSEFKKTGFLEMLKDLDTVDDINTTQDIFSYQHFYVIYCKFWELDMDHDMQIDLHSLALYDRKALTPAILKRIVEGFGKPLQNGKHSDLMTYEDFIWFILSVEDKNTPQAIEYWFRCLDLDGDGVISLYELSHFYKDQYERMLISRVSDIWKFEDFACSLYFLLTRMDLISPATPNVITLNDLKQSRSASMFFDMIFDLKKYDHHLRRCDPMFRELDDVMMDNNDGTRTKLEGFKKFAAKSYLILAEEESNEESKDNYDIHEISDDLDSSLQICWDDLDDEWEIGIGKKV